MGNPGEPDDRKAPNLRIVSRNENLADKKSHPRSRSTARERAVPDIYVSIGECVALRRRERGISSREFAFALGVKPSQLKKYENGLAVFTPDLLLRAAQVLDVQPSRFFVTLAEKRLAALSLPNLTLDPGVSVADAADKIRFALFETISKCDSIVTILDIIDASKNI